MDCIGPELMRDFRSRSAVAAAEQWAQRIHGAFYGAQSTRGSSKFLALEAALTDVLERLSSDGDAAALWQFAVLELLVLAQEPAVPHDRNARPSKKSSKKCQPNAPLAFLLVNALKKLIKRDRKHEHKQLCLQQGRQNLDLREFCKRALVDGSNVDQKLLVELLELFRMTDIEPGLVRGALERLIELKSHAAVIKLCATFTDVDWPFEKIVARMVRVKDWTSAELLVRTYEAEGNSVLAGLLIDETIELRDFKRAHRYVLSFKLQKHYPDIDVLYSRDGLMRLIESQRWQLAITFVGNDIILQKVLLEHMLSAGELIQASHLAKKMIAAGCDPDILKSIESSSTVKGQPSRSHCCGVDVKEYLKLPSAIEDVIFCDSKTTLEQAAVHFFGSNSCNRQQTNTNDGHYPAAAQVVGLDVEWKPVTSRSQCTTAIASILQVASATKVFVIDLLSLHDNDYLFDSFLLPLFTSPKFLKLGFSFESDLKVLRQTFPERQAFAIVAPFLDLNSVTLQSGKTAGTSLSQVTSHILGKSLDKGMQLSDWEQRPLTPEQLTYAALDAWCLVQIATKIKDHHAGDGTDLPSWQEVINNVDNLSNLAPQTNAEILEARSRRNRYHDKWRARCAAESVALQDNLVSPQDITRFWNERKANMDDQVHVNTSLKFLPMDQIKNLMEEAIDPSKPRNFIAVNSICIFADEVPCVVCIDAGCKLDMARFARFCGIGRRKVRLATETECREVFGFAPGSVAPFGHKSSGFKSESIQVYADSCLQSALYLAAGCGSLDEVLWVESKALFALTSITLVGDISTPRNSSLSPSSAREPTREPSNPTPDEATQEPHALEYKFLTDSMVTQVGRWLRTIGVDVVNWNPDDVEATRSQDPKSVMLARAAEEDRIVLTRDTSIPSRRDAGACFVLSDDECYKQFREVKVQFGLLEKMHTRASRCARCNSSKFSPIDAAAARKKVSQRLRDKVPTSVTTFWICNGCSRLYWEGPKYTKPTSLDGSVVYRPVPRKRIAGDKHDQRHLPDP